MRTAKTVLTVIQERGKQHKPIERVYKLLFNRDFYLNAYAKLYPNNGAMTKGVTEETIDGMSIQKIDMIIEQLRQETYYWRPARREYIPKKNGKPRLISAPDRDLKKKQRMLLPMLYRIHRKLVMDMNLQDIQHGFIPGKNCVTAAQKHIGFRYTTQLDISDFFNSCLKDIHFRGMHKIVRYKNTLFHDNGYCAQG